MAFINFKLQVKKLSEPRDFDQNSDILNQVIPSRYSLFLDLLKHGAGIKASHIALEKIFQITVKTSLTDKEVMALIPEFRFLVSLIDGFYKK